MINYERLQEIRLEKKITLLEIADALGLQTPGGYSRIESGENKLKADHLPVLAKKFNMSLSSLIKEIFFEDKLDVSSSVLEIEEESSH